MKKTKSKNKPVPPKKRPAKAAKPAKPAKRSKAEKTSKKKVLCEFCGAEIPSERLEILPDTTTCVQCSQTKPYSEAQIIGLGSDEDSEQNRLNAEDFEDAETDFSVSYNDSW
jgi:hypothetical protein